MPVAQPKTVVIHARGMVAAMSTNAIVQMLSKKLRLEGYNLSSLFQMVVFGSQLHLPSTATPSSGKKFRRSMISMNSKSRSWTHLLDLRMSIICLWKPVTLGSLWLLPHMAKSWISFTNVFLALNKSPLVPALFACPWNIIFHSNATSRVIHAESGALVSPSSASSVRELIKLLIVKTRTNVNVVICPVILPRTVTMRGVLLLRPIMLLPVHPLPPNPDPLFPTLIPCPYP